MRLTEDGLYTPEPEYIPLQAMLGEIVWPPKKDKMKEQILKLIEETPGITLFVLADKLKVKSTEVNSVLRELIKAKEVQVTTKKLRHFHAVQDHTT